MEGKFLTALNWNPERLRVRGTLEGDFDCKMVIHASEKTRLLAANGLKETIEKSIGGEIVSFRVSDDANVHGAAFTDALGDEEIEYAIFMEIKVKKEGEIHDILFIILPHSPMDIVEIEIKSKVKKSWWAYEWIQS